MKETKRTLETKRREEMKQTKAIKKKEQRLQRKHRRVSKSGGGLLFDGAESTEPAGFENLGLEEDSYQDTLRLSERISPPPKAASPVGSPTESADEDRLPPPAISQRERASTIATRLQERLQSGRARADYAAMKQEPTQGTFTAARFVF